MASVSSRSFGEKLARRSRLLALAVAGLMSLAPVLGAHAQEAPGSGAGGGGSGGGGGVKVESVSTGDVRADAVRAIKSGDIDRGVDLLQKSDLNDPANQRLAAWATEYETQRQALLKDRREKFDKAVADVRKLVDAGNQEFPIDFVVRAYVLAEDKDAFVATDLVRGIITRTETQAAEHEAAGRWVQALRLYSDLAQVQPLEQRWKDKLKSTTRRVRLLATYNPDQLTALRDADQKLLDELDKIIPPTTPRPATRPTNEVDEAFKVDWRQKLRGINADMLWTSLIDVRGNYWRDVEFRQLIRGGIAALRTVASTDGLSNTFPSLADTDKVRAFLARLDQLETQLNNAPKGTEVLESSKVYRQVLEANKTLLGLPEELAVFEFADGAFAECDPFTSMIWPDDVEEFNKSTQGEFSGVGIQIQSDDDGSLKVVSPLEDSPAFRAGIKAGDVITHVNAKPVKGITTNQAVRVITGPSGSKVTLTVKSFDGTSRDYDLVRETIKVQSVKGFSHKPGGGWDYILDSDNRVAYLRITNFTKSTGDELERAADELKQQGARALIVDLRYNPGGLLSAAIDVSNRFLDNGVIVSTRADRQTNQPSTVATARPDPDEIKLPLVVLVNQYSASASEIVSGALKDQGRAVVVGERSFGKGSVQMLFPVDRARSGTAFLKLTTSHYYLPSGVCLHREENSTTWGVDPQVRVEMTPEQMNAATRARTDFDVLRQSHDNTPANPDAPKSAEDLIKVDNQLGAALLLLRLQLNGMEVAQGTPAPGVQQPAAR